MFQDDDATVDAGRHHAETFSEPGTPTTQAREPRSLASQSMETLGQRYCLLFERNLAGVYRTTLDGKILDCNESMASMLGYGSRHELMSRPSLDLYFDPADRESFLAALRKNGQLTNAECCLRKKDGTPIHILENVSLVPDEEGKLAIIQGTMVDISERMQAEEALRGSETRYRNLAADLRRLTRRLQAVREEERTCIARELHDELGQTLTALNMDLYWLEGRCRNEADETQARISAMRELVNTTIQAVHRICADLRPPILDDFGLAAAIEWQTRQFQSHTGICCRLSLPDGPLKLPREQATALFRILQESLTNVARHAQATDVRVNLENPSETILLEVCDNGIGITEQASSCSHSLGLAGMRERALAWGGQVEISGTPHKGTTVKLRMPMERNEEEVKA